MKFIIDNTVSAKISEWLSRLKHDVITSNDKKKDIIHQALQEDRVIISNDPAYGETIMSLKGAKPGIILIAIEMDKPKVIIDQMEELFHMDPTPLEKNYVMVIARGNNRIMKLPE